MSWFKKSVCLSVVSFASYTGLATPSEIVPPIEIPATVESIHVPFGFDDNDNVEIVVRGILEDSCKRVGRTSYEVDNERRMVHIKVTTFDYKMQDVICYEMINPFLVQIRVGVLHNGTYKVDLADDGDKEVETYIAKATTQTPDQFLYAPISDAELSVNSRGEQTVALKGEFPRMLTGCMVMKEVVTYKNPKDILVVLPIAEVKEGSACQNYKHQFKINHVVETKNKIEGESLLHIRVSNGQSYNRVVTDLKETTL